jgi:NitT/TauT family transport system substrate-binding protein
MDGTGGLTVRPSRRQFCQGIAGLGLATGGLAFLAGCGARGGVQVGPALSEAPLETTRLRFWKSPSLCHAPQFLAEPLLRAEGFTDVQYVDAAGAGRAYGALAAGEMDIISLFSAPLITRVDAGDPIVILAGLHVGCFELFGTSQVQSVRDLKGKTAGVLVLGSPQHVFLASIAAYVGLDPRVDINFVVLPGAESMRRLEEGTIDAFIGFPPEPQELRAKKIGHVVVNSAVDKPWSQYFCCVLAGNREFVQQHPVATRRAMRALLKATDMCGAEPDRAAQLLVDGGYTPQLEYARQALREIPYSKWRDYDPEDAIRFYSLRLQEIGMIKSTPNAIIETGTNWRFLNELKQELKT